jgi:hypothetical protein
MLIHGKIILSHNQTWVCTKAEHPGKISGCVKHISESCTMALACATSCTCGFTREVHVAVKWLYEGVTVNVRDLVLPFFSSLPLG